MMDIMQKRASDFPALISELLKIGSASGVFEAMQPVSLTRNLNAVAMRTACYTVQEIADLAAKGDVYVYSYDVFTGDCRIGVTEERFDGLCTGLGEAKLTKRQIVDELKLMNTFEVSVNTEAVTDLFATQGRDELDRQLGRLISGTFNMLGGGTGLLVAE